jgi:hypothetical protein
MTERAACDLDAEHAGAPGNKQTSDFMATSRESISGATLAKALFRSRKASPGTLGRFDYESKRVKSLLSDSASVGCAKTASRKSL